jgi:phosphoglycolate phosphatase
MAAIIFDFDGTLADSFDYVANFLIGSAKHPPLTDTERMALHGMSMAAMARQLGYRWWRLPGLLLKGRRVMAETVHTIQPFAGMPEVIKKLHAEGHELFILSSNNVHNIHTFLHQHKLHTYFLELYGGIGLFGKAPALRRLLKDQSFEAKDAIYIGDELRDVQAAKSLDMRVVAVAWGFAKTADLEAERPTDLARTPQDLMKILEEQ